VVVLEEACLASTDWKLGVELALACEKFCKVCRKVVENAAAGVAAEVEADCLIDSTE